MRSLGWRRMESRSGLNCPLRRAAARSRLAKALVRIVGCGEFWLVMVALLVDHILACHRTRVSAGVNEGLLPGVTDAGGSERTHRASGTGRQAADPLAML